MIALISDIHGNYEALRAVLAAVDKLGIKKIYCLGDVAGYYSQVNECCDELRKRNVESVMGNHDWYLLSDGFCLRSKSADDCIQYQKKVITPQNLAWLQSLGAYKRAEGLFMVHGGWNDPVDEYLLEPSKEYFDRISGKYFASGHTHIQRLENYGEKAYCNPGSVGQPRDDDSRAAFATWDGKNFELHRVEYDIEKVGKLMEKAGFNGYYYGSLFTGARRLGWREGAKKGEPGV